MLRHNRKLLAVGYIVTAITVGAMVLRGLSKYLAGDGLETYRNAKGALLNYAGALVTGGVLVVCIVGALLARWWHFRQERRYEDVFKAREVNTERRKKVETGS